jgi:hypothetical protein
VQQVVDERDADSGLLQALVNLRRICRTLLLHDTVEPEVNRLMLRVVMQAVMKTIGVLVSRFFVELDHDAREVGVGIVTSLYNSPRVRRRVDVWYHGISVAVHPNYQ